MDRLRRTDKIGNPSYRKERKEASVKNKIKINDPSPPIYPVFSIGVAVKLGFGKSNVALHFHSGFHFVLFF